MTPNSQENPYIIYSNSLNNMNINSKNINYNNNKNYENINNNNNNYENNYNTNLLNSRNCAQFMPEIRELQSQLSNISNSQNQSIIDTITLVMTRFINFFLTAYNNLKNSYDVLKQDYNSLQNDYNNQKNSMCIKIRAIEKRERETKKALSELDIKYQEALSTNDSINMCSICMSEPISHIYTECGHYCICQNCVHQTKQNDNYNNRNHYNCPICRKSGNVTKVFIS